MKQLVIAKAQDALMASKFASDKGDDLFMICRNGAEYTMEKKVETRRPFYAWVNMEFIGYVDETTKPTGV